MNHRSTESKKLRIETKSYLPVTWRSGAAPACRWAPGRRSRRSRAQADLPRGLWRRPCRLPLTERRVPRRAVLAPGAACRARARAPCSRARGPPAAGRWALGYWPPGGLPLAAVACGRCRTARAPCPVARRPPTASPRLRLDLRRLCLSSNEPPAAWTAW